MRIGARAREIHYLRVIFPCYEWGESWRRARVEMLEEGKHVVVIKSGKAAPKLDSDTCATPYINGLDNNE